MPEKQESVFKVTKERKRLFRELHKMIDKYPCENPEYGKGSPEVELWLAKLNSKDFHEMMMLPIGNYTRNHYTRMRLHALREKVQIALVYYGKESKDKVDGFFDYLRKEGFECKMTGPINSSSCPWVYVYLYKKEYIIGKPGIDFAPNRAIKHSILIDDFKSLYSDFKKIEKIDDDVKKLIDTKYNKLSVFCFDKKEERKNKRDLTEFKIKSKINDMKFKYYYNKYSSYEEFKNKVLLCMVKFNGYPNKEGALVDYKCYEKELYERFSNHKEFNPSTTAYYISMGF